jgi:DNA-binding NarL/FixJ family response regulator
MNVLTALIVSHEPILCMGWRRFLSREAGFSHWCEASDASAAVRQHKAHRPAFVVVSASLVQGGDIRLIEELSRGRVPSRILICGRSADPAHVVQVLQAGALGYVTTEDDVDELRVAMMAVLRGDIHISQRAAHGVGLPAAAGTPSVTPRQSCKSLSSREAEVLGHIRTGLGCKATAAVMGISVKTVETHQQRIKEKLGLQNNSQLRQV